MPKEQDNLEEKINFPEELVQEYKNKKRREKNQKRAVLISTFSVLLIAFIGISSGVLFSPKISADKIVKGLAINQNQIITGVPVKWTMYVKKEDIANGKYLAKLPKGAKDIKVTDLNAKNTASISLAIPKQQLSLEEKKALASIPQDNPKNSKGVMGISKYFCTGLIYFLQFMSADLGAAVDNVSQTITGGSTTDQNVVSTNDATYVDVSAPVTAPESAPAVDNSQASTDTTNSVDNSSSNVEDTATPTTDATVLAPTSNDNSTTDIIPPTTDTTPVADTPTPTNTDYVAIQYTTPAPQTTATVTDTGEQVIVSATNEDPATPLVDVLASTKIPKIFKVGEENKIKIKWKNNGNQNVTFQALDTDNDGYLDYVEWTVPHLSEQIFDIIFISKAFQLDNQQNIIADIYPQTQTKDGNYASLTDGQFIRVTFDQTLTNKNDNTIYARPHSAEGSAEQATIQVYPAYTDQNGNVTDGPLVATFPAIDHEATYKVLLTSLTNPTDLFDLKIVGNIDVDYIVDPSTPCTTSADCSDPTAYCDTFNGVCTDGSMG